MNADKVWIKRVGDKYEVVVTETKLSQAAPFTTNQNKFIEELAKTPPNTTFELRSKKFEDPIQGGFLQGTEVSVKAYVKTVGDGTTNAANTTVKKIF